MGWQIIGYNYKGELFFNHYSVENTVKATSDSKQNVTYFDYGFENIDNENFVMYLGQYKDEVTGLYYNYNRDYSHKLKRYIQIDPLKLYDGSNPYIYVGNNQVNYFDFYGLKKIKYRKYVRFNSEKDIIGHSFVSLIINGKETTYGFGSEFNNPNKRGWFKNATNNLTYLKGLNEGQLLYYKEQEINEQQLKSFYNYLDITKDSEYLFVISNCESWTNGASFFVNNPNISNYGSSVLANLLLHRFGVPLLQKNSKIKKEGVYINVK